MVKVFHGCYPSQVFEIFEKGWAGSLTEGDRERQLKHNPKLDPVEVGYVTLDKDIAAGYPSLGWSRKSQKLGEKFTDDDTPPYTCVLEGTMAKWDTKKPGEKWTCNVRWKEPGEKKRDANGASYRANQQWAVIPESVTWEVVHYYPTGKALEDLPLLQTLKEDMASGANAIPKGAES